ncbi:hypothetical protein CYMTET_43416, partial [Cymbomonas tetramitiformis]
VEHRDGEAGAWLQTWTPSGVLLAVMPLAGGRPLHTLQFSPRAEEAPGQAAPADLLLTADAAGAQLLRPHSLAMHLPLLLPAASLIGGADGLCCMTLGADGCTAIGGTANGRLLVYQIR